ncbi:MAG: cadmium-translocating P-type ATPase [Lachnospiraceae bacterium]|nr:cadmium-translocating P-type ATPase [Lachnospiraceae bacterium]
MPDDGHEKRVYILENLGCPNCAAKMEQRIQALPGVSFASVTYATKQLRLSADHQEELLPQIQEICASIESEVRVVPRGGKSSGAAVTRTYILENLGCPNCAAKMEQRIWDLPGVTDVSVTYATKQLRVTGPNPDRLVPQFQEICASIEPEVCVVPRNAAPKKSETEQIADKAGKKKGLSEDTRDLLTIALGAILFIVGEVLEHQGVGLSVTLPIFLIGYLILGGEVLLTAFRNLTRGQVFDENFLMSIATLGALAIAEYPEAVGVMLFYRIGEFFEQKATERSRSQIMDAIDLRPEVVNLLVGEAVRVIPAEEAQVGDILLVRPGDRIPLDSVIVEGESRLDTSAITGEPVPVTVSVDSEVLSGCVNTSGQLKIRVTKPLEESMVTRILDSVENAAASKPQIDRFITRFSRVYTPFVVLLALCTAIIPSIATGNWNHWVYTALTFLVISCPCALVLSVPLSFFCGIGAGSKRGILFKGGVAVEQLAGVKAVVMDKTGTITEGNFVVQEICPAGDFPAEELLSLAAGAEQNSTHPIAHSIVTAAQEKALTLASPSKLEEIAGHGIRAEIDGRLVLCGNRKLMEESGIDLTQYEKKGFGSEVLLAVDGVYAGHLVIADTIKSDAKSAIAGLKKLGITTAMLTGDAQDSAEAVAAATGIDEVHARLLPQDKLTELGEIRKAHTSVMFVGDGINDAPVLAGADVGAAMGSGADAAIEAADVVFMNSNMEAIPQAVRIARFTRRISWQNVVFALVIKALVMILGLFGIASMWMAVFADTGVTMLCVLNAVRILYKK